MKLSRPFVQQAGGLFYVGVRFFKARVTITEEVRVKTPRAQLLKWLSHVYV